MYKVGDRVWAYPSSLVGWIQGNVLEVLGKQVCVRWKGVNKNEWITPHRWLHADTGCIAALNSKLSPEVEERVAMSLLLSLFADEVEKTKRKMSILEKKLAATRKTNRNREKPQDWLTLFKQDLQSASNVGIQKFTTQLKEATKLLETKKESLRHPTSLVLTSSSSPSVGKLSPSNSKLSPPSNLSTVSHLSPLNLQTNPK